MKYYLAFDKGQAKRSDNEDRFVRIDLSSFVKNGYFTSLKDAVSFTSRYENYSDLFLNLLSIDLIDKSLVGEPFCLCYQGKEAGKVLWKNCGTKRHIKENKILFKEDACLFEPLSEYKLKNAYIVKQNEKRNYIAVDDQQPIELNFTHELYSQELSIPNVFKYETADQKEKDKFDFISAFVKEVGFIVSDLKRSSRYATYDLYKRYVNTIDSFNNDLKKYLYDANNYGHVDSRFFVRPIQVIIQLLCLKSDDKKETYKMNNSQLYELITFYLSFYDKKNNTIKNELQKICTTLEREKAARDPFTTEFKQEPCYQIDFWGNEIPLDELEKSRRRKK